MDWINLNSEEQINEIDEKSFTKTQIIFKHSTRCSISLFAKKILLREYNQDVQSKADVFYLDLIAFRQISNKIASKYHVVHESPQILVIKKGRCVFHASHSEVSFDKAFAQLV
ncbi:MAG: bacillithiol system redox-active protein YtxJ [Flavobacteriales bacterium]|nr:bacillithiol system redox-active protein YtxJ [Flavobacteriales bacterium]|tara:strand:+ start:3235 stop:3573 length:339 start_codon:yes stop_codon:yes gene_type:complete